MIVEITYSRVAYAVPMERLPSTCEQYPGHWLVSPCIESHCKQDPTECCLKQVLAIHDKPKNTVTDIPPVGSRRSEYRCKVCGETDRSKFYRDPISLCKTHHNQKRCELYAKNRPVRGEYTVTRSCCNCSVQFQTSNIERFRLCEACRKLPARKRIGL